MSLRSIAVALNILLLTMFATYFFGHGLPTNPVLWGSATLWLVAPLANLLYIKKPPNPKSAGEYKILSLPEIIRWSPQKGRHSICG